MSLPARPFPTIASAHTHLDGMFRITLAGANAAKGNSPEFQRSASMSVAYCDAAEVVRALLTRTPAEALADLIATHGRGMPSGLAQRLWEVLCDLTPPAPDSPTGGDHGG